MLTLKQNKELNAIYIKYEKTIKKRIKEFNKILKKGNKEIFSELVFCLCTPQSKAVNCDKAVKQLIKTDLLLRGNAAKISKILKGLVRFHNNKAKYIIEARDFFLKDNELDIKRYLKEKDIYKLRNFFYKNIKGLGLKESSHFLRNIGKGEGLAILDVHILKNLVYYNIIKEYPKILTEKKYYEIEKKFIQFSERLKLFTVELDFVLWAKQTGYVFK